jgi:hypothetical protein
MRTLVNKLTRQKSWNHAPKRYQMAHAPANAEDDINSN